MSQRNYLQGHPTQSERNEELNRQQCLQSNEVIADCRRVKQADPKARLRLPKTTENCPSSFGSFWQSHASFEARTGRCNWTERNWTELTWLSFSRTNQWANSHALQWTPPIGVANYVTTHTYASANDRWARLGRQFVKNFKVSVKISLVRFSYRSLCPCFYSHMEAHPKLYTSSRLVSLG